MKIDRGRMKDRLVFIRARIAELRPLAADPETRRRRLGDPISASGVVHHLQTSIEAMIDIAFHLCAKLFAREPESAADAFCILAEGGALSQDLLERVLKMVRFRNLVVHGYLRTDMDVVEKILQHDLQDFEDFADAMQQLLRTWQQNGEGTKA
jgi:uncharacterized protein YutE (UPF0331/DUF86 family)